MRKMLGVLLFVFAFTLTPIYAAGPLKKSGNRISPLSDSLRKVKNAPGSAAREALRKFVSKTGDPSWRVRYNPKTALPEAVVGGKTRKYPGGPEAAALAFLNDSKELLKVDAQALRLALSRTFMGVTHLQYEQLYNSIPVEFAYVRVHVNASGEVIGCQSRFEPDINVGVIPSVSADYAAIAALADSGLAARVNKKELVVFPDAGSDGALKLAWKLKVRAANAAGGVWFYYVDASNGAILFKYNDLRRVAAGTVTGTVYDISPLPAGVQQKAPYWEKPVSRPIRYQYVWIQSYDPNNRTTTGLTGAYSGAVEGKVFASLKGPRFAVTNFRGPSAHFDNGGGSWYSVSTLKQSPHPYENSQNYPYNVTLTDTWTSGGYGFAKVMPRFAASVSSPFEVGTLDIYGGVDDGDTLAVKNASGETVGSYIGRRTAPFFGAAVEGPSYSINLKTDETGVFNGFSVDISSYLLLSNPTITNNPTGSIVWSTTTAGVYMDNSLGPENALSEVNAFYHLNKVYDYFGSVNKDPNNGGAAAANLLQQVPVMVHAHGDADNIASVGGMLNAYYDLDNDSIIIGDGQLDSEYGSYHSFALDGTIIRHEYTHLVIARIYPIINFGEFGAVSEAVADYFSLASFRPDGFTPDIIGNFVTFNANELRDLSGAAPTGARAMPASWVGEVHDDSLILSQALWALKNSTPTTSTDLGNFAPGHLYFPNMPRSDIFVYASLFYFPDNFANFHDAMLYVCRQLEPVNCNTAMQARIDNAFAAHGISVIQPGDAFEGNNGPEWATDISTISSLSATISPVGDVDYYSLPLAAGDFSARLDLPVAAEGYDYKIYYAYSLLLFDNLRKYVTEAAPALYEGAEACPASGPCYTSGASVTLNHTISASSAGRYYLAVIPGQYGSSQVNSPVPYRLNLFYTPKGSARADLAAASYDNDRISFSVPYLKAPMVSNPSSPTVVDVTPGAEVMFDHAQLRDHNYSPLALARTDIPGNYLELVAGTIDDTTKDEYSRNVLRGSVRLKQGFSNRYPGVGTIYLEIFGRNHMGRVISLGVSNAINLSTNKTAVTAYNNIITGANSRSIIKYDVLSAGTLSIKIYTQAGALVKTVYDGPVPAGKGTVDWDGTNDIGAKAASGIYFMKVTGAGLNAVEKIAVVR